MGQYTALNMSEITDWAEEVVFANLLRAGRNWAELKINSQTPYRRSLSNPNSATGMPQSLPAGVMAETWAPIRKPGRHVVRWDGGGHVAVYDGAQWVDGQTGSFAFTKQAGTRAITVRILSMSTLSNLRITHEDDEAGWTGFAADFVQRMGAIKPRGVRVLDWMGVSAPGVTDWADRRPDGWFTESEVWQDTYTLATDGFSGAGPGLGDIVEIWSGTSQIGTHYVVDIVDPQAEYRVRVRSGSLGTTGQEARFGADTATLIDNMTFDGGPRAIGCSPKLLADFSKAFTFVEYLWIPTSHLATDDYHTQLATYMRDNGRANLKVCVEYTNESWNTSGPYWETWNYCNTQGGLLGMPDKVGGGPWYQGAQFYAYRSAQIHAVWKGVYAARPDDVLRVMAGQNAVGEEWYRWRTIINPDNDPTYPAWPYEVKTIDVWSTAPYWALLDAPPYNTNAWIQGASDSDLETYAEGQIDLYYTLALDHHRLAGERAPLQGSVPCVWWPYEAGQHMIAPSPTQQATVDRIAAFQNSQAMFRLYSDVIARQNTLQSLAFWYNSGAVWGSAGFWGLYEDLWDVPDLSDEMKYRAVRGASGQTVVAEAVAAESEWNWEDAAVSVVRKPGIRNAVGSPWTATSSWSDAPVQVVTTKRAVGSPWSSTSSWSAAFAEKATFGVIGITRSVASDAWTAASAWQDAEAQRRGSITYEVATDAWSSTASWQDGAAVSTGKSVACDPWESNFLLSGDAETVEPIGTLTANRHRRVWVLRDLLIVVPKRVDIPIYAGAFCAYGPGAEWVVPLQAGWDFAGVAIDPAAEGEETVILSRFGAFAVPITGHSQTTQPGAYVAALSDDELVLDSSSTARRTRVGRSYWTVFGSALVYSGIGVPDRPPPLEFFS